jgi:hypothetical protein
LRIGCSESDYGFALLIKHANVPVMRLIIFSGGLTILATGGAALYLLNKPDAIGFLVGAMQLGGGIVICGLFSLKMQWHGIIGAGILALLGMARGLGNVPGFLKFLTGERPHGVTPVLELGVTVICALLLARVIQALFLERTRRMLESEE